MQVKAIDRDAGQNGHIYYSIAFGNKGNMFSIGSVSGILTNNGVIDREAVSMYTLHIGASDGKQLKYRAWFFLLWHFKEDF